MEKKIFHLPSSLFLAAVLLVAWGALAFGAVYPWAYTPLLAGCALTGATALVVHRSRRLPDPTRLAVIGLLVVLAAGAVQLVPLPASVLDAVSPKTGAFLESYDLGYAFGSQGEPAETDSADSIRAWHPLSLAPRQTLVGLGLLAAFTLLLAGLTTALSRAGSRRLTASIVIFGVLLALIGIVQKAVLGDHAWGGMKIYGFWQPMHLLSTPFGPYVNKNHFAGWMLMGLPLALGLALGLAEQGLRSRQHGLAIDAAVAVVTPGRASSAQSSRDASHGCVIADDKVAIRPRWPGCRCSDHEHCGRPAIQVGQGGHGGVWFARGGVRDRLRDGGRRSCGPHYRSVRRRGSAQEHLD